MVKSAGMGVFGGVWGGSRLKVCAQGASLGVFGAARLNGVLNVPAWWYQTEDARGCLGVSAWAGGARVPDQSCPGLQKLTLAFH